MWKHGLTMTPVNARVVLCLRTCVLFIYFVLCYIARTRLKWQGRMFYYFSKKIQAVKDFESLAPNHLAS